MPYLAFVLFQVPLALTITQILAIDLGTDMLPGLALAAERPEAGVMERPPRRRTERLLSWSLHARAYLFLGPPPRVPAASALRASLVARRLQLGDQIAHRLAPRSLVFLPVHADAIGLVTAEALGLRVVDKVLLKPRSLADKEYLMLRRPTSTGPSCHDVHGRYRVKIGIDGKNIKIMDDVVIA